MIGLLKRNNHAKRVALTRVVSFVLHNNFLTFNGCFWRQRSGIAMGTPLAPPLANLYMYTLETEVLSSFEASKFFYRRYLDDILVVFFGNEGQAAHMQQALSNMKPHIRLKFVKSCFQVDFLDFVIGKHTCHVTGARVLTCKPFLQSPSEGSQQVLVHLTLLIPPAAWHEGVHQDGTRPLRPPQFVSL